ncbi:MAG: thioredoxin domain-containing protein [Actinobacteria bacterium]|nr:thioredoxin domain-containing protein [Actinomycetota bacterium]
MNRLAEETSPYLRQHKDNPVDWYPWGDDAFARAREEDKPILLSVGYSACHWCHVMAHESFEDDATAAVMNELFVNVKVDREERPDVDAVYMEAVQAMTGRGGWPMTVFLTPDGKPFFGGTYYPPERRHGMPSFTEVLIAIRDAWRDRRPAVIDQAGEMAAAIESRTQLAAPSDEPHLGVELLEGAYSVLRAQHDDAWGGFGGAPKFPQPSMLDLLLRAYSRNGSEETLTMVITSLDAMAGGGIYDHLGGGFARYSVDEYWLVPHFEKMLYDQAGLARVYLHAWQVTGEARYLQVVDETIAYVLRDLRSPAGGLYSAEDADSEGVEGKFYVWSLEEVERIGGQDAVEWYGVTAAGNFAGPSAEETGHGTNILTRPARGDLLRPPAVEAARQKLFDERETRVRPGLDDKVLTEWNAMMLSALCEAAAATGRDDWRRAAVEIGEFLLHELRDGNGRWLRSWHGGRAKQPAFATDYAWLVDAFTRLGELTGQARWMAEARRAADGLLELFWDGERGAVFTTGEDSERLIVRSKDLFDGATPSANSVAAVALTRLGALAGEERYTAAARGILALLYEPIAHHPTTFTHALAAVDLLVAGVDEVAVVGDRPDLVEAVQRAFHPNVVLAWGEPFDSPLWQDRKDGLAYVCRHYTCRAPARTVDELLAQL